MKKKGPIEESLYSLHCSGSHVHSSLSLSLYHLLFTSTIRKKTHVFMYYFFELSNGENK